VMAVGVISGNSLKQWARLEEGGFCCLFNSERYILNAKK